MSWEMAMARPLISSQPQILWDPAKGQETGAPRGYQMGAVFHCRRRRRRFWLLAPDVLALPGAGAEQGSGREREARKVHFSLQRP